MPQTLFRLLAATLLTTACATACTRSGPTPTNTAKASDTTSRTSPTRAVASADGSVGTQLPNDSISERADAGRILGDSKASVWLVMVSDFQCPFCKTWHDAAFQQLLTKYVNTGHVRMAFLNMPLSMHPNAVPAAEAAMCASVQSKFWPMHEALFASQSRWETMANPAPVLDSLASTLGVSMAAWRQCVSQHQTRSLIQADHDRASSRGVNSTPTFFVGDQRLSGTDANLSAAIDAALAKAGNKPGS
jgi:protein-disulfide isomerase